MRNKKAQGMSINTIIIAVLVLVVLIILIVLFTKYIGQTNTGAEECRGTCVDECTELQIRGECTDENQECCFTEEGAPSGSGGGAESYDCEFESIDFDFSDCDNMGVYYECSLDDDLEYTITYSGDCPSTVNVQIDHNPDTENCIIRHDGDAQILGAVNFACTSSPCVQTWKPQSVISIVPVDCVGETIIPYAIGLRVGSFSGDWLDGRSFVAADILGYYFRLI